MSLLDLWKNSPDQVVKKLIQQIIGFAGDGRLGDRNATSLELREFLSNIPTEHLERYASECLTDAFKDSGLALQDIVNEVGHRLGFTVTHGRYRGVKNVPGFDGLWVTPEGHSVVVEVKTTDAYRIDLDTIAKYRKALAKDATIEFERSSVLIVVGRNDTGDLEAQIRGSKHAWEMRLISVGSLLQLLRVKEGVETPGTEQRVRSILLPREFTRLDEIINLVFSTSEEAKEEEPPLNDEIDESNRNSDDKRKTPVNFYAACVPRLQDFLQTTLVKRSRISFASPDGTVGAVCAVSKAYENTKGFGFWFAFHPHQLEFLRSFTRGFVVFGCGSADNLLAVPVSDFEPLLPGLNRTTKEDGSAYWHVQIEEEKGTWVLLRKKGQPSVNLTRYRLVGR